jgi:hypothetical protein
MTYRFTPVSAQDISTYTHIRAWIKIASGEIANLSDAKFRAVTSSGNYLEWSDMVMDEDCWSYDSFEISQGMAT